MDNMTGHLSVSSEDQAVFLATRWMSVKQLEEAGGVWLVRLYSVTKLNWTQSGILCRKGWFTTEEIQKIHDTIQMYQKVCRHPSLLRWLFFVLAACLFLSRKTT